jgi:3-phenylpropionate/trans-cinnamate dioxygenase ferredoxin reductase subunit
MVIVGAGECGARAAIALRENGFDGPVTLIGEEAHPPYERPPLSKAAMTGPGLPLPRTIVAAEELARSGIEFIGRNRAAEIDPDGRTVRLGRGRDIRFDRLLLATGAVPRRLPLAGSGPRIAYLRSLDDALAIRSRLGPGCRVAIVGGGFIGLELAASARRLGAEATVIEAQPRILMRGVPAEIAAVVHELHSGRGVGILCGEKIEAMRSTADTVLIGLGGGRTVEADLAVIGIGAIPATDLADRAGLAVEDGIAVDERLRTSHPDIFAAGDCCSFPLPLYGGRRVRLESWRTAREQGCLAALNMLGANESHAAVPWFWSDQWEMTLFVAGLADEGRTIVRRDLGGGAFILFHLAADGRLAAASGIGPGEAAAKDVRLAEMLISRKARPAPAALASPETKLKSLLAA